MTGTFEGASDRALLFGQEISATASGAEVDAHFFDGKETQMQPSAARTELLLGPYRAGKTGALIDDLLSFCLSNPFDGALVVVPSQRYRALFEKRVLERLKSSGAGAGKGTQIGIAGLQILPFYNACQVVLRRAGVAFRIVPEAVRAGIVAGVLAQLTNEEQLQTLEPVTGFAGTHAALLDLIDELERAALSPSEVLSRLERTAQSESRYAELARIYLSYWQELARLGYMDERGAAFAAREVLSTGGSDINFAFIAADGFDRFNLLQLHVLEGLSRKAGTTKICFDYVEPESDPVGDYAWKETSYKELKRFFGSAQRVELKPDAQRLVAPVVSKRQMLDRFFEAAEVARTIKQRMVSGVSPSAILVVARSISAYAAPIHAAFEDAGISYFLDEAVPLNHVPVIQLILRMIELASLRNYKRTDVIGCLRSPYFRQTLLGEAREKDLYRLEQLSFVHNVIESKEQWSDLISGHGARLSDRFRQSFCALLDAVSPPKTGTMREYLIWVEDLIDRFVILPSSHEEDPFARWQEHRALYEWRRCLAGLMHEENILGAGSLGGDYFLSRLRTVVERSNFRRLPHTQDAVTVCSADLAPNISYDEVFILGLCEGEFPKRAKQTGFLSADELERWFSFAVDLRNPRFHPAFESALFSSLLTRARHVAHLSCPVFDHSGEELLPSYFMSNGSADEAPPAFIQPFEAARGLPVSAKDALSGLLWFSPNGAVEDLKTLLPLTTLVEALSEPIHVARLRAYSGARGEFNGDLRDFVATGTLALRVPQQWSATRLNDYGKCPFRYWATHAMNVEPREEPSARLNPMVLGETYHKALELFYRTLAALNINLANADPAEALRLFEAQVERALNLLEQRSDIRHGEFWRYERNEIAFRLRRFFHKELKRARQDREEFVPTLTETSFGLGDQSHSLLRIRDENRDLFVRGRIDRVDVAAGSSELAGAARVRVIDYKAGSAPITRDDAFTGRNIQLPLYALAVERSIMPGSRVVSGQYLSVSSGEPSGRLSFEPDEKYGEGQPDLKKVAEQHVRDFVHGIECGDYSVRPNGKSVCKSCIHRPICRVGELAETLGEGASEL